MDSKSKKIHVGSNLLVGLKAELLRKQEQTKKPAPERTNIRFQSKNAEVTASKKSKTKTSKESKQIHEQNKEELADLEKARKILERKAKLYEQMTEDVMSIDDTSKLPFLVDFEQKAIDEVRDMRARGEDPTAKRKSGTDTDDDEDEEEDSEWVDYKDSFGRSRRCLRKDLPHFEAMDKKLAPPQPSQSSEEPHLLSSDMRREMERKKWEEAMNELRAKEHVHYSDVMFDEIRDHGVGFFNFSRDEKMRKEQMDLLNKLREQTKTQRKMFASTKEKKRKMLEIRLAKIMQRKVIQEAIKVSGLDPHTLIAGLKEEEEPEVDEEEGGLIGDNPTGDNQRDEDAEVDLLKRDDSWRKDAPVREWDVGKKTFDEDAWLDKRREERISEFAPTYVNGSRPANNNFNSGLQGTSSGNDSEDMVALNLKKLRMLIS